MGTYSYTRFEATDAVADTRASSSLIWKPPPHYGIKDQTRIAPLSRSFAHGVQIYGFQGTLKAMSVASGRYAALPSTMQPAGLEQADAE